jgi:hypothetical protein
VFLPLYVRLTTRLTTRLQADERGQTTAEYALVLLGAASVALLLAVWARDTNRLGRLLDAVVDTVIEMVE